MRRTILNFLALFLVLALQPVAIQAQSSSNVKKDKRVQKFENWQNCDLKKDKKNGVSTDLAYSELLKGKTSTEIVVAVIDGGVDIYHEDLKDVIWTNPKEIPGNGIDDDNNGYIDDIHGWSFLGTGKKGSLVYETLEITREYGRLMKRYGIKEKEALPAKDTVEARYCNYIKEKISNQADFSYFMKIRENFSKKYNNARDNYNYFSTLKTNWEKSELEMKKYLNKDTITASDIKSMDVPKSSSIYGYSDYLKRVSKYYSKSTIDGAYDYFDKQYKQYNLNSDARKAVGDDPENFNDTKYGNNDVKGDRPFHGTMVSGIIAAKRNNNIGMNGVADNVKIMAILVVPDGDERDKDVALAIRYATDNGAKIINMSFGKEFSPNKKEVLEAMEYAAAHNVLLVHAAGNESMSNDTTMHYPSVYMDKSSKAIPSFIEVGASTIYKNKKLPASFSNYGPTTVDIFAPGEDIYTTNPESTYDIASGTSFSCPLVSGVAALVWSYYPQLTAKQVKEIIIASGVSYSDLKVIRPSDEKKAPKIKFGQLSISGKVVNVYQALKLAETYKN
jgi:cell wall-associated protease